MHRAGNATVIGRLALHQPFPWQVLLRYLGPRLMPGVERVEADRYVRKVAGGEVVVSLNRSGSRLLVSAVGSIDASDALVRCARLFDVRFDPGPVIEHLQRSKVLAACIARAPGMRPLGAWSAFELCVRTILGQQVTVAAAGTLMRRLTERCGAIAPQALAKADLTAIGMPGKRVETLRHLAGAVCEGLVLEDRPWSDIDEALRTLPGFGPWTRAYLAIRLGREPDAFPDSDIGLLRGAGADSSKALLKVAERWRPYRAHAATYLWSAG